MKALGYVIFVEQYPELEIEKDVGLRYRPDLVARRSSSSGGDGGGRFHFWGECGAVTMRKTAWLLKHGGIEQLVIFKIRCSVPPLVSSLRAAVDRRYRPVGRLLLINFAGPIAERTLNRRIARVPQNWYTKVSV